MMQDACQNPAARLVLRMGCKARCTSVRLMRQLPHVMKSTGRSDCSKSLLLRLSRLQSHRRSSSAGPRLPGVAASSENLKGRSPRRSIHTAFAAEGSLSSTSMKRIVSKDCSINPRRIDQQRVFTHLRHRRFEMQATGYFNAFDRVPIGREKALQLFYRRSVTAARQAHVDDLAHAQHIAAVQRAGRFDGKQCAIRLSMPARSIQFQACANPRPGRVMMATSSNTSATSSTKTESGRSGSGGREMTSQPSSRNAASYWRCCARARSRSIGCRSRCVSSHSSKRGLIWRVMADQCVIHQHFLRHKDQLPRIF